MIITAPVAPCTNNAANPPDAVGTIDRSHSSRPPIGTPISYSGSANPLYSPNCRWRLDATVDDRDGTDCYMRLQLLALPSRRLVYDYCSDSANVFLHWLSDGHTAVINDYNSADTVELFVMTLDDHTRSKPLNLADVLGRDFQKRAGIDRKRFIYHFYPSFEHETPEGIEVSLREDDVDDKNGGPAMTRCFIYHFFKPDYRRYKLISRIGPIDMDRAPCNGFAADRK